MIMYAGRKNDDGHICDIYPSKMQIIMCGNDPFEVDVTESPDGEYYGWQHTGKKSFSMIYPSLDVFDMCFPYGYPAAEKAGSGRMVKLSVSEV